MLELAGGRFQPRDLSKKCRAAILPNDAPGNLSTKLFIEKV